MVLKVTLVAPLCGAYQTALDNPPVRISKEKGLTPVKKKRKSQNSGVRLLHQTRAAELLYMLKGLARRTGSPKDDVTYL